MRGLDMKICCLKAGIVGCFWIAAGLMLAANTHIDKQCCSMHRRILDGHITNTVFGSLIVLSRIVMRCR